MKQIFSSMVSNFRQNLSFRGTSNVVGLTLSLAIFVVAAKAQAPQLWGTCETGGAFSAGTIIKSDSTGSNFQVVYSFDQTNGAWPLGNLCSG